MNKIIIILVMIVFAGCAQKNDISVTKKIYPDISRNAIFDAAKTLFNLSNKENGNKDFIIDAYRNKLEVDKVILKNNILHVDIVLDKWILELYQTEEETRANLTIIRKDGLSNESVEDIDENLHKLFWDRLDYLLGIKKDWEICNQYFSYNLLNNFCSNYFVTFRPQDSYIQNNILISQEDINKNTIDTIKADIYQGTDLTLIKSDNDIFNQTENIEDVNILSPVIAEDIFESAQNKNNQNKKNDEDNVVLEDTQIDKFKETLQNIINKQPENQNTDSNNIIFDSNNLKENSEFELKSK